MGKKGILAVCSVYNCLETIIPVYRDLVKKYSVTIFCLGEMSNKTIWNRNTDPRDDFYREFGKYIVHGCSYDYLVHHRKRGKKIPIPVDLSEYGIAFLDDNLGKKNFGYRSLYNHFLKHKIVTIASPHGNRENKDGFIDRNIGLVFDKTFVFGKKELNFVKLKHKSRLVIPSGIPSNDILKDYPWRKKYILVIVGFVSGIKTQKGYSDFTKSVFYKSGILKCSKEMNIPIVIKEKSNQNKNTISLSGLSTHEENVKIVMDTDNNRIIDDNRLIADAACLISAPSTLCFKAIQKGIPTVLLRRFGMLGSFYDFDGVCDADEDSVIRTMDRQIQKGRDEDFIVRSLEGGINYTSTQIYTKNIEHLLESHGS